MTGRSSPRPPCRSCPAIPRTALAARVLAQEHRIYPLALRSHALGVPASPAGADAALCNPLPAAPASP